MVLSIYLLTVQALVFPTLSFIVIVAVFPLVVNVSEKDAHDIASNFNGNEMVVKGYTLTRDFLALVIPPAIVVFAGVQGVLRYINTYLADWISVTISNSVKIDLFKKLVYLDSKFYDENSSGLIYSRFAGDPDIASRQLIGGIKNIITSLNLKPDEVLYIGDDINDAEVLRYSGYKVTVPNANSLIKDIDGILVTDNCGGEGVLREITDAILGDKIKSTFFSGELNEQVS